ncbi:hypothetical protein GGU11DRAFT_811634, partial [Lentinula aff. detonsa]
MYDERSTPESYNYGYTSTTDPYHPSLSHSLTPSPSPSPPPLPTYPPSLFCRAKYPYTAQDASALTFTTGSIIEVLTRQESGWWDGMLGDERGWFPSNYVEVISEEEAEREWGEREREMEREMEVQGEMEMGREWGEREGWEGEVDMGHALISASASSSSSSATDEWLAQALSSGSKSGSGSREREGRRERGRERERESASDFWMPQVASNGQIFYINTKTGEQSRDLPLEAEDVGVDDDDDEEEDEEGYYHHHHQEGESVNGEYGEGEGENGSGNLTSMFGPNSHSHLHPNAHTPSSYPSTPEPWIKRLADDGLSYYYLNTLDGSVQWDRPSPVPGSVSLSSSSSGSGFSGGYSEGYSANTPTTAVPRRRGREGSLETETETETITDVDISNHSHPSSSEGTFIELDHNPNPNPNHSTKSIVQPHLTLPSSLPSPLLQSQSQSQLKLSSHLKLSSQLSSQLRAGLVPPPPTGDHPMEMIRRAREAIEGVVRRLSFISTSIPTSGFTSSFTSTPIPTSTLIHTLIEHVILTLRNLLYICSSGSGSGTGGDRGLDLLDMGIVKGGKAVLDQYQDQSSLVSNSNSNSNLKSTNHSTSNPLKPAQRKLTATLSRLVLSARAVEYEDGDGDGDVNGSGDGGGDTTQSTTQNTTQSSIQTTPQTRETLDRIRGDAIELGKALDGYAKEVERVFGFGDGEGGFGDGAVGSVGTIGTEGTIGSLGTTGSTGTTRRKRLYAVFDPAGLGLGMLGAGRAGDWLGFGLDQWEGLWEGLGEGYSWEGEGEGDRE